MIRVAAVVKENRVWISLVPNLHFGTRLSAKVSFP